MLTIHRSNRVEALAALLAASLNVEGRTGSPLDPVWVAVHSRGMERWLSHQLAQVLGAPNGGGERPAGICAGVHWPFPAAVIGAIVDAATGAKRPRPDPWGVEALTMRILRALQERPRDPALSPLEHWLSAPPGDGRAWRLATTLADLLDRYATWRPEWALEWVDRSTEAVPSPWQATLGRRLRAEIGVPSPAERLIDALHALREGSGPLPGLPPTLRFFGITQLPPAWIALLRAASRRIDVELYLPSPSNLHWTWVRRAARDGTLDEDPGPPLLGSLGAAGRDFQRLLEDGEEDPAQQDGESLYIEPTGAGRARDREADEGEEDTEARAAAAVALLRRLQSDILNLRSPVDALVAHGPLAAADDSVVIAAAPGAARQVDVVRDLLLRRFDADPTLEPRDVVIMTPDVEGFAPLVAAAFGEGRDRPDASGDWGPVGAPRLPVHIADRPRGAGNSAADALLALLDLGEGRLTVGRLVDCLSQPPFWRRLGGSRSAGELGDLLRDAGALWGWDAEDRAASGQPEDALNTLSFALDRLALGALQPDAGEMFAGVRPYGAVGRDRADQIGRLLRFVEPLRETLRALRDPMPLAAWALRLQAIVADWMTFEESDRQAPLVVYEALAGLSARATAAGLDAALSPDVRLAALKDALAAPGGASGQHTGAITLCELVPMRSVPHRVIVLLGLDEDRFPRAQPARSFDEVTRAPRLGDRDRRQEDRYLFLEALLSARDAFIATYDDRDLQTNDVKPPSPILAELLDAVSRTVPKRCDGSAALSVVHHPLHAFDPKGFRSDKAEGVGRRYDRRHVAGARALDLGFAPARRFFEGELPSDEVPRATTLDALARFFANPAAGFVQGALRARLDAPDDSFPSRESFTSGGLEGWSLSDAALQLRQRGLDPEAAGRALRQAGGTVPGAPGARQIAAALERADLALTRAGGRPETVEAVVVDLRDPTRSVGGALTLADGRIRDIGVGRLRAHRMLGAWIRFLAATASGLSASALAVGVVRKESTWTVQSAEFAAWSTARREEARMALFDLVSLAEAGRRRPLVFFPERALALALGRPPASWHGNDSAPGVGDDAYVKAVWGDSPPQDDDAEQALAAAVFAPMLAAAVLR